MATLQYILSLLNFMFFEARELTFFILCVPCVHAIFLYLRSLSYLYFQWPVNLSLFGVITNSEDDDIIPITHVYGLFYFLSKSILLACSRSPLCWQDGPIAVVKGDRRAFGIIHFYIFLPVKVT